MSSTTGGTTVHPRRSTDRRRSSTTWSGLAYGGVPIEEDADVPLAVTSQGVPVDTRTFHRRPRHRGVLPLVADRQPGRGHREVGPRGQPRGENANPSRPSSDIAAEDTRQ